MFTKEIYPEKHSGSAGQRRRCMKFMKKGAPGLGGRGRVTRSTDAGPAPAERAKKNVAESVHEESRRRCAPGQREERKSKDEKGKRGVFTRLREPARVKTTKVARTRKVARLRLRGLENRALGERNCQSQAQQHA